MITKERDCLIFSYTCISSLSSWRQCICFQDWKDPGMENQAREWTCREKSSRNFSLLLCGWSVNTNLRCPRGISHQIWDFHLFLIFPSFKISCVLSWEPVFFTLKINLIHSQLRGIWGGKPRMQPKTIETQTRSFNKLRTRGCASGVTNRWPDLRSCQTSPNSSKAHENGRCSALKLSYLVGLCPWQNHRVSDDILPGQSKCTRDCNK